MKGVFVVAVLTVLVSQMSLGYGDDGSDEVDLKARQYNCPYYYMMKNSGPPTVMGLSPWLLLCLAAGAMAVSTDYFSLGVLISKNTQRL